MKTSHSACFGHKIDTKGCKEKRKLTLKQGLHGKTRGNGFKLEDRRFRLDINKFFEKV